MVAFDAEQYDWYRHLSKALKALPEQAARIDRNRRYYEGDHPRVWISNSTYELFRELNDQFIENWCEPVIDKPLHRLEVTGWIDADPKAVETDVEGKTDPLAVKTMTEVFKDNDLEIGQSELYRRARIDSEAFLMLWLDEEKESGFDIAVNDARCVYWPPGTHRSKPEYVVKVWIEEETNEPFWRATIYYSKVVVRLVGPKQSGAAGWPQARYFQPDTEDPGGEHGFKHTPVVRFALRNSRRSILDTIIPLQDQINKLKANKMVAAEFSAYRQRVFMTEQDIQEGDLHARPNKTIKLHPGGGTGDSGDAFAPTSIWESTPDDLSNYDNAIDKELQKIFTFASLPRHILVDTNSPISGDGIEADEGDYVEMLEDHQRSWGGSWSDLADLLELRVKPQWRAVAVRSDKSEGETVKLFVDAGVNRDDALVRYAGWSEDEIKAMNERPLTPEQERAAFAELGTAVALGADPEQARTLSSGFGAKKPPVAGPPSV